MSELISTLIAGVAAGMPLFLVASGLTLTFGVLRVLNFAHGAFFMLGAFLLTTVTSGHAVNPVGFLALTLLVAIVLGVIGVGADAFVFKRLYGRPHVITLLASYALLLVLEGAVPLFWGDEARSQDHPPGLGGALSTGAVQVGTYDVFLIVAGLVVGAGLYLLLQRTSYGMIIKAVSTDEVMARAMGIRSRRVQAGVFALGAALAGLAGALIAPLVSVDNGLAPTYAIASFAIVIIGGLGSTGGALAAALILGIADSLSVTYFPSFTGFSLYIAVAIVLLLRPQGLAGKTLRSPA